MRNKNTQLSNEGKTKMTTVIRTRYFSPFAALIVFVYAATLSAPLCAQTAETSAVTVRVEGARNTKGKIGVALFQSADGFPGDTAKALRVQQVDIDAATSSAQAAFEGIPHGEYAVAVFHDENMNGKLDKNFVGAPKEGYGASNNPKKRMGPPRFEEAKFSLNQPAQTIAIKLIY
jgi:uncharacterized protein (DUF2141 family)